MDNDTAYALDRLQKSLLIGERPNRGSYLFRTRKDEDHSLSESDEVAPADLDQRGDVPISREVR